MLTEDRVDAIFKEMDSYILELESDPASLGPQYFQNVIATCRNYLNAVGLVISELNREKLEVSSELRKLEAAYALEHDNLLANNERVRFLASVEDRKATVGFMLREEQQEINKLKDRMHQLDAVYKVVNYRNKELHATMTAIKDQRRLIQIEIDSGSFYGDERTGRTKAKGIRSPSGGMALDDLNEEELANMLDEPDEEADEGEEESGEPEPDVKESEKEPESEETSEVTEEDVAQFLDSPAEGEPQPVVEEKSSDTTGNGDAEKVEDVLSLLEEL